jgi:hypothetical protein
VKRLHLGRLSAYIEPRDIWVGVYVAPNAVYVCPLPLLVLKWERRQAFIVRWPELDETFAEGVARLMEDEDQ